MNRLKNSYSGCMNCGGKIKMKSGGKSYPKAVTKSAYSAATTKKANLAKTLAGMRKGEDGMITDRGTKNVIKYASRVEPRGITTEPSSMGMPVAPNTIESPANWYNESTWDKAQAENATRPIANASVTAATSAKTPLAKGGTEKVRAYQEMLRSKGADIKADGAWGPLTQIAYETYIKSKASGTAKPAAVTPAKTTSKASSETWNYTPEQWDKSMAENKAREAAQSMKSFNTTVNTVVEPAYVNKALSNVSKYKASKAANAKKYVMDKLNKFNKKP